MSRGFLFFFALLAVVVAACGCGGGASAPPTPPNPNPVPTIAALAPPSATAGGTAFTLTVNGSNFVAGSVVRWNGSGRPTAFVSSGQLTAQIPPSDIAAAGMAQVTVFNPAGGGTSNAATFTVNNPVPTLASVCPNSATAGGAGFTLTVAGTNFIPSSVVNFGGIPKTTMFVSSTQLTATISANDIANVGAPAVTVFNPGPGGGTSGQAIFPINPGGRAGFSLRFHGNGINAPDLDRVKILIHSTPPMPDPPANVGATDFTLEFWMKANAAENAAAQQACGANINWIFGNIVFDRDRFNQDRKFGLSIAGGRFIFGVSGEGTGDLTICDPIGGRNVLDSQWHHVAVQRRRASGQMWLFVDGNLEAQGTGPGGDVSYPRDGVPGSFCGPNGLGQDSLPCTNDLFLVIGAEKHDAGPQFPSFSGWITEVRLSNTLRYLANFTPAAQRFGTDPNTAALYHFGEGQGDIINDSSNASGGPSPGVRKFGPTPPIPPRPAGPEWSTDTPPFQ